MILVCKRGESGERGERLQSGVTNIADGFLWVLGIFCSRFRVHCWGRLYLRVPIKEGSIEKLGSYTEISAYAASANSVIITDHCVVYFQA